jgi:hypothetical protein
MTQQGLQFRLQRSDLKGFRFRLQNECPDSPKGFRVLVAKGVPQWGFGFRLQKECPNGILGLGCKRSARPKRV